MSDLGDMIVYHLDKTIIAAVIICAVIIGSKGLCLNHDL